MRHQDERTPINRMPTLVDLSLVEYLQGDCRPAFAVGLDVIQPDEHLDSVFTNQAFLEYASTTTLGPWLEKSSPKNCADFREWMFNTTSLATKQFHFEGQSWSKVVLQKSLCIVSGDRAVRYRKTNKQKPSVNANYWDWMEMLTPNGPQPSIEEQDIPESQSKFSNISWIRNLLIESEFVHFFCSVDWSSTALGPIETWPVQLQHMTSLMLADSRPVVLLWGPSYVILYNESYVAVAGPRHPQMLGSRGEDSGLETWRWALAEIEKTRLARRAISEGQYGLIRERYGDPEETTYRWTIVPIMANLHDISGYYIPILNTTKQALSQRRYATLADVSEALAQVKDMKSYWKAVLDGLYNLEADIPVAVLYSVRKSKTDDVLEMQDTDSHIICDLEGTIGVIEGHSIAPASLEIFAAKGGLAKAYKEAMDSGKPTLFSAATDGYITGSMLEGIEWRGFGDPCRSFLVVPLSSHDTVAGFLFIALNPRSPYDIDYQQFITLLSTYITASLTSVILFENEAHRGRASLERFRHMAALALVGLFELDVDGTLLHANDHWYDMTGHLRDGTNDMMSWMNLIMPEDHEATLDAWRNVTELGQTETVEVRLNKPWIDTSGPEPVESVRWVLCSSLSVKDASGKVVRVQGVLADITLQKKRAEDALERARLAKELIESEARFQRITELAPAGIFVLSCRGTVVFCNKAWYELTGHPQDNSTPWSWQDSIYAGDYDVFSEAWDRVLIHETPVDVDVRLCSSAQNLAVDDLIWARVSAYPSLSEDGRVIGIAGSVVDISHLKFAEEIDRQKAADAIVRAQLSEEVLLRTRQAKDSEQKLSRFAEMCPIGMFIVNKSGDVVFCNKAWANMTEDSPREFDAMGWLSLIVDEDVPLVREHWRILVEEKRPTSFESRIKRKWTPPGVGGSGAVEYKWAQTDCFPELDDQGAVKNVIGCLSDITHFKWAAHMQENRVEEALKQKRQKEYFIDMTSHEMRNPLSAVIQCADSIVSSLEQLRPLVDDATFSSNLQRRCVQEPITRSIENAQTILSCGQHQKRVVDDILTMSKLDSNLLLITPVSVQPLDVVRTALQMFSEETRVRDMQTRVERHSSLLELRVDWLYLDPSRLLQILINLLTNAIKFTKSEAKREIKVTISATLEASSHCGDIKYIPKRIVRDDLTREDAWGDGEVVYLHCQVTDSGRGLTAAEKENLFLRFSQASPRTHIEYGGSGLGLFICRELAELQGGEIGVASQDGVGSTFAFYIKTRRAAPAENQIPKSLSLPLRSLEHNFDRSQSTVMVVEDNVVNQKVLRRQLQQIGFTVSVANHGDEALSMLKQSIFWKGRESTGHVVSILLLDIEMPIMDGLSCVRKIREFEKEGMITSHVPVIGVSANARLEQIENAIVCGMDDFISKPFRIPDLIPKVERLLDQAKSWGRDTKS